MTAKFKVGDEVTVPNGRRGRVVKVTTAYTLQFHDEDRPNGLPCYEHELRPYVRTLAVGDRVTDDLGYTGVIRHIEGNEAAVLLDTANALAVRWLKDLERIPDAGKAVKS